MHDREKSDRLVVPTKPPNKLGEPGAEVVEGRGLPEGNTASETRPGPSAGQGVSSDLERVRRVAQQDRDGRFTALLHHVTVDRLREAYRAISPNAAPGIDGVTWRDYGVDLEANLRGLHARVHGGAYRASPTRRVFIPKADGRLRPLGVAALEDKIVQRAVVEVLNAIYELGRAGARCRRYRRSVSPTRPPNRTCPFLSIRLSTGHPLADRDAALGNGGLRRGGGPSCSGGRRPWRGDPVAAIAISGDRDLGGPREPRALRGWSSCAPSIVA
jgi:RNA-directed DNA polymerase